MTETPVPPARLTISTRIAALLAIALVSVANRASAQSRSFKLEWSAPEECPDERRVRRRVEELIARGPDPSQAVRLVARGTITRREPGFRLELFTERNGERGQRELEDPTCAHLADAAALILALLQRAPISANGGAEASAPTADSQTADATAIADAANPGREQPPATPATSTTAPSTKPSPPPQRTASVTERSPSGHETPRATSPSAAWSGALAAGIAGNWGILPRAGLGFAAGGSVGFGRARAELIGAAWGAQRESAGDSAFSSSFRLLSLSGALCYAVELSEFELGPCAGIVLSQIRAHGRGPSLSAKEPVIHWASALVAGRLGWRISRHVGLEFRADVAWSPVVARFVVDGVGPIYKPSAFGLAAWLGPSLRF